MYSVLGQDFITSLPKRYTCPYVYSDYVNNFFSKYVHPPMLCRHNKFCDIVWLVRKWLTQFCFYWNEILRFEFSKVVVMNSHLKSDENWPKHKFWYFPPKTTYESTFSQFFKNFIKLVSFAWWSHQTWAFFGTPCMWLTTTLILLHSVNHCLLKSKTCGRILQLIADPQCDLNCNFVRKGETSIVKI